MDHLPRRTKIDEKVFDDIEKDMSSIKLTPEMRYRIRLIAGVYEGGIATSVMLRGSVGDRKIIRRIAKRAGQLCDEITALLNQNPLLAKGLMLPPSPRRSYEDVLTELRYFEGICKACVQDVKKGEIPKQIRLGRLVNGLKDIYLQSEGTRITVTRPGSGRHRESPFVSFAWEIIGVLPVRLRPRMMEGLANAWESWQTDRNKANPDGYSRPRKRRAKKTKAQSETN